jgi:hypothetical protein
MMTIFIMFKEFLSHFTSVKSEEHISIYLFSFGVWPQGLMPLGKLSTTWATLLPHFCLGIFLIGSYKLLALANLYLLPHLVCLLRKKDYRPETKSPRWHIYIFIFILHY